MFTGYKHGSLLGQIGLGILTEAGKLFDVEMNFYFDLKRRVEA